MKKTTLLAAFLIILCAFLCGCKGAKEIVREIPVYVHDTTYQTQVKHDSTYIDRWHTIEVKGDTILKRDSLVMFRYIKIKDTVFKVEEKPVVVHDATIIEKERELTKWQKFQMRGFWLLGAAAVVGILYLTRKFWLRLIKK